MTKLYRYSAEYTCSIDEFDRSYSSWPKLKLTEYKVIKETNKTWRIIYDWDGDMEPLWSKIVRKNARKKWACPTKEEAARSYLMRKTSQMRILTEKLKNANAEFNLAQCLVGEFNNK